jgi:cytochrome c-type biogenesis protein CcmH/NrfF
MFYLWAIPVFIILAIIIWVVFYRLQHRVHSGQRKEGKVLKDE